MRTFLFTCSTKNRRRIFQVHSRAAVALDAILHCERTDKYTLHAAAIMPDHIHVLVSPPPEITLERIASMLKGGISFRLRDETRGELWETGYHDVRMRTLEQTISSAIYIRDNPTAAGMKDWPFVIFRPETIVGGTSAA